MREVDFCFLFSFRAFPNHVLWSCSLKSFSGYLQFSFFEMAISAKALIILHKQMKAFMPPRNCFPLTLFREVLSRSQFSSDKEGSESLCVRGRRS